MQNVVGQDGNLRIAENLTYNNLMASIARAKRFLCSFQFVDSTFLYMCPRDSLVSIALVIGIEPDEIPELFEPFGLAVSNDDVQECLNIIQPENNGEELFNLCVDSAMRHESHNDIPQLQNEQLVPALATCRLTNEEYEDAYEHLGIETTLADCVSLIGKFRAFHNVREDLYRAPFARACYMNVNLFDTSFHVRLERHLLREALGTLNEEDFRDLLTSFFFVAMFHDITVLQDQSALEQNVIRLHLSGNLNNLTE